MPQRQRPRLKQYTITCSQCGTDKVKLLPSRRAVLAKMSRFHFCSPDHQRLHWEARRRAAWTASPYPCRRCGKAIIPEQRPGRPPLYCSECRPLAALERQRRDPAAAVLEAHEAVLQSWSRALGSALELVRFYEYGSPVIVAYEAAKLVTESESSTEEERSVARQHIVDVLLVLHMTTPYLTSDEPSRRTADWTAWWSWWKKFLGNSEAVHGQNLEWLRIAGVELRRAKRVVARRAETARLRRSRRETTSASNERLVDSHPEADAASGPACPVRV